MELLEEAKNNYEADYAIVQLFEIAEKNPKKKPFTQVTIKFSDDAISNNVGNAGEGFAGLGFFGGLDGIMQTTVQSTALKTENKNLEKELNKVYVSLEKLETKNEKLSDENVQFKDKIKNLEWELKQSERQREIDNENSNNRLKNIDTYLPALGTVVANIAKIDGNQVRSLLGLDSWENEQEKINKNNPETNTQDDVDYEKVSEYEGEKLKAKQLIDSLNNWLVNILDSNDGTIAFATISEVYKVFDYIAKDTENLKTLTDLIKK